MSEFPYEGLDPEEYRRQLDQMGASKRDADAAVAELIARKRGKE